MDEEYQISTIEISKIQSGDRVFTGVLTGDKESDYRIVDHVDVSDPVYAKIYFEIDGILTIPKNGFLRKLVPLV